MHESYNQGPTWSSDSDDKKGRTRKSAPGKVISVQEARHLRNLEARQYFLHRARQIAGIPDVLSEEDLEDLSPTICAAAAARGRLVGGEDEWASLNKLLEVYNFPIGIASAVLEDCIDEITVLKGKQKVDYRPIIIYNFILGHMYAEDAIRSSFFAIRPTFLKLLGSANPDSQIHSLHALALSLLNHPTPDGYHVLSRPLQRLAQLETTEETVRVTALHVLGVASIFGRPELGDSWEMLEFLQGVIESDGSSLGAPDSAAVVAAALHVWMLVASCEEDVEDQATEAMGAFVDQLDSVEIKVQTAAAEAIAFVFEESRRSRKNGDKEFNIRQDLDGLLRRMERISSQSIKVTGRKSGRQLKSSLANAITSLRFRRGPNYSTGGRPSHNPHTGGARVDEDLVDGFVEFGYRDTIISGNHDYPIDSWGKWAMRNTLSNLTMSDPDIARHLDNNPHLSELFLALDPADDEE